jgi:putative sigma-54 modulation protein
MAPSSSRPAPAPVVEIRSPDFPLTPALRTYAMEHLAAKLLKHARRIQSVVVRFEDRNGRKSGVDKVCRVEVLMPRQDPLIVEEVDDDLRAAIDLAADRIDLAVHREVERLRTSTRHRGGRSVRQQKMLR